MADFLELQARESVQPGWREALGGIARNCCLGRTQADLQLEVFVNADGALDGCDCWISLRSTACVLSVGLARDAACTLADETWRPWLKETVDSPPADLLPSIWNAALADLWEDFGELIGQTLEVVAVTAEADPSESDAVLSGVLQCADGATLRLAFCLPPSVIDTLVRAWSRQPLQRVNDLGQMRVSVVIEFGWREFTRENLRGLAVGDVIVLEYDMSEGTEGIIGGVRIEGRARFNARLSEREATIISLVEFEPSEPDAVNKDWTEELAITLVFEAGRQTLPLGEVESLQPGHCFVLPGDCGQALKITVNGQVVGEGELVRVGSGYGVRLKKLGVANDATADISVSDG